MPRVSSDSKDPAATIGIHSFGEKAGGTIPKVQFEFDVTKFRDPGGQKQFSKFNGTTAAVRDWVGEDERAAAIISTCLLLADDQIKLKARNDGTVTRIESASQWLSISFRDFHGKWVAPAIAELVANALVKEGYPVTVIHHNLMGETSGH